MHLFSEDIHGWRRWEYSVNIFKICAFECQFARLIVCFNETCLLTFYSYDHFGLFYIQRWKESNVRDVPNGGGII